MSSEHGAAAKPQRALPATASALALAYLATAVAVPALALPVAVLAAVAACALVLAHRDGRGLRWTLAAILVWLAAGLGGAAALAGHPLGGLAWVVAVVFLAPLPFIPWLYARTFRDGGE